MVRRQTCRACNVDRAMNVSALESRLDMHLAANKMYLDKLDRLRITVDIKNYSFISRRDWYARRVLQMYLFVFLRFLPVRLYCRENKTTSSENLRWLTFLSKILILFSSKFSCLEMRFLETSFRKYSLDGYRAVNDNLHNAMLCTKKYSMKCTLHSRDRL